MKTASPTSPQTAKTAQSRDLFHPIRRRLLFTNLLVFALVLGGFAGAIRFSFIYNLRQQLQDQLRGLARGGMALVEVENGEIEIDSYEPTAQTLITNTQGLQWFNRQGDMLEQLGEIHPTAPLDTASNFHRYHHPRPIQSFTTVVRGEEQAVVYIRANQTLTAFHESIELFDRGLGLGMVVALGLSSLGSMWLNRQAMRPIEASFNRLKQFTADASHELRNPIMAISSNAEVALKYADGMRAEDKETLELIVGAAEQMAELSQDLLLLARLDKRMATEMSPIDLSQLLENLSKLYRPQANEKQIQLKLDLQPGLRVRGNATLLIRAFTNLLQNALRYTEAQGSVLIRGTHTANQITIAVRDTGIGIAEENLDKVFERFWRADKARVQDSGGTGLGLAITQAIIHNHNGELQVSSRKGEGSCFTVLLPSKQTGS